jgi:adenylate cyclase
LQDQVASSVAGAIEPHLRLSEIERAARKPTANLTANDLYLRALAESYRYIDEGFAEAVLLARQYAHYHAPEVLELFVTGVRLAGLPEK